MNKVFLDDALRDPNSNGHTLESWLLSIRDNPDVMHVYFQGWECAWGWHWTDELLNLAESVSSQDNYKLIFGSHKNWDGVYRHNPLTPPGTDNIIFWPESRMYQSGYYLRNPDNFDINNHPRVTGNWSGNYTRLTDNQQPTNFHNYWFDFIVEKECKYMFFSEKTWRSIIYGKPFIILGVPSQNWILRQWGFQLFPELIDYQLDHMDNPSRHSDLIKPVIDLTNKDIRELDHLWMPRYKHNYELWKYIIMSDDYIPDIIREEIYGCPDDFFHTGISLRDIRRYVAQHKPDFENGIYI